MKLTLADTASGYDLSPINNNFSLLEQELQDKVLYRDNPTGEPNQMEQELDMNSYTIYNLPDATEGTQVVNLSQLQRSINAASSGLIARLRETRKIAAADQKVFNLSDITYTPGVNNLQVYINGVAQIPGIDYEETSSTMITFFSGLAAGDAVDVYTNESTTNITDPVAQQKLEKRVIRVGSVSELSTYTPSTGWQALVSGSPFIFDGFSWVSATGKVFPEAYGADVEALDNSSELKQAFDSGYIVDGGGKTYNIVSPIVTTNTNRVDIRNLTISTPLEVSADQVDFSSTKSLNLENFQVESSLSGRSNYTVTESQAARGWKYHRSDDGEIYAKNVSVKNYKAQACSVDRVAVAFIENSQAFNVGMGQRFTGIQAGFINGIRTNTARRIGVTFQSATNTLDHDDLKVVNVSVDNIYPGIGSGGDLHGIGVEIHNFVDEALASNIRARKCHSMGISLSGCEHGNVRNVFVKTIGYTDESATSTTYRGFAGVEIVDSDAATVQGSVIDVWQTFVRFDKSHFARVDLIAEQNDSTVSSAFRFFRYQGTASDFNNAAWSCEVNGIYRNNTSNLLDFISVGLSGTYLDYRHRIENVTIFNCNVNPTGKFRFRNVTIEDDGVFTNAAGIGTLFDLNLAGDDIDIADIEYIGIDSSSRPDAFCRVSSSSINSFVGRGLVIRNIKNILTAASGTLAEMLLTNCFLDNVDGLYTGTVSSTFRLGGSENKAIPRIAEIPIVRHGNSTSGLSGQSGDILWKRGATTGNSPGWMNVGGSWVPFADMQ